MKRLVVLIEDDLFKELSDVVYEADELKHGWIKNVVVEAIEDYVKKNGGVKPKKKSATAGKPVAASLVASKHERESYFNTVDKSKFVAPGEEIPEKTRGVYMGQYGFTLPELEDMRESGILERIK